jgi:hypothetical protein
MPVFGVVVRPSYTELCMREVAHRFAQPGVVQRIATALSLSSIQPCPTYSLKAFTTPDRGEVRSAGSRASADSLVCGLEALTTLPICHA